MRKERREEKTTYSFWGIWMDGEAGQVRAVWPSYRSKPARKKAVRMGVPMGGHPSPPRELHQQPSRTPCRSGKKSIRAGQENKLEGQSLGCAVGSEDQALPLKRRWSLATLLFTWLGFKEMNYFSAFALPPRRQIPPFRVGNERPVRKSARGACSQTLCGTSEVSLPSW